MDIKVKLSGLDQLKKAAEKFLEENQEVIADFIRMEPDTAESYLMKSILFDLLEQAGGIVYTLDYLNREVVSEGNLYYDPEGNICLNDRVLSEFEEIEVYFMDRDLGQEVWMRTYPIPKEPRHLAAL